MRAIDIRKCIDQDLVKKIFGNVDNAKLFLHLLNIKTPIKRANDAYDLIVKHWDYDQAYKIIRQIFKETPKYKKGKCGEENIKTLLMEWKYLGFGDLTWPFSQGQFDNFVQSINASWEEDHQKTPLLRKLKDEKVKEAAVKYRRIKEINTERNDYLETLIFLNNENVIPTLHHSRGLDFFIDGISFDQKVAKSPTKEFKRDFGENWRQMALKHPEKVAEYLYTYQDEGRFGQEPRLFIVYLDEDISPIKIKRIIEKNKLVRPYSIHFNYQHKSLKKKSYKTEAFVILLANELI